MGTGSGGATPKRARPGPLLSDWLAGQSIELNGHRYSVHASLKQHGDRSFSFYATERATRRDVVIRTFDRRYRALEKLVSDSTDFTERHEVVGYESYGAFRLDHPTLRHQRDPIFLHAVVRAYEPKTLADLVENQDLSSVASMAILRDVARGLTLLHGRNYAHGRLNADNVLVADDTTAAVTDYGLSGFDNGIDHSRDASALAIEASAKSISADIEAFGRLAEYVKAAIIDNDSYTRNRLDWIVWKCLSETPQGRIGLEGVLSLLVDDDEVHRGPPFRGLVDAATLEARRVLRVTGRPTPPRAAVELAAQALDQDSQQDSGYRLRDLDRRGRTHILVMLAIIQSGQELSTNQEQLDIIPKSDVMQYERPVTSAQRASYLLDPLWHAVTRQSLEPPVGEDLRRAQELAKLLAPVDAAAVLGPQSPEERARLFQDRARVAARAREHLLTQDQYVRTEAVQVLMSSECPGITADDVRALRDSGYLLHVPVGDTRVYPMFQFEPSTNLPFDVIRFVYDALGSTSGTQWGTLGWWWRENRYLSNMAPARHLQAGRPERDIELAIRLAEVA